MHPFLQFPGLFFLAPLFVPVLLRFVVALSLAAIALTQYKRREEISLMRVPLIGTLGNGMLWLVLVIEVALAAMFLVGYYTQLAALAGLVLCIKHFIYAKKYSRAIPLCRVDYVYLFVICLALVCMGAGAFAMDLPL